MIRTATATMPRESDTDTALSEKLQALGIFMTRYGLAVVLPDRGDEVFRLRIDRLYARGVRGQECLGKKSMLVLASVTEGDRDHSVSADKINLDIMIGNKLVVGTVNANREYFEAGVYAFARAELELQG